MNIYLIGYRCTGKTSVGDGLSRQLDWPVLDSDVELVREENRPISEIVAADGWDVFRQIEKRVIQKLSRLNQYIIATGGGAVLDPENWRRITGSGTSVFLSFPAGVLAFRLRGRRDRPLLDGLDENGKEARIRSLLKQRTPAYSRADLTLHLNRSIPPERIAAMIVLFAGIGGRKNKRNE